MGFCSERVPSSESCSAGDHCLLPGSSVENQMEMSGTPSWVPPNQTQPRRPSGRVSRLAAWLCTVGAGRYAKSAPSACLTVPSGVMAL